MQLVNVGRSAADEYINLVGDECINIKGYLSVHADVEIFSDSTLCGLLIDDKGYVLIHTKNVEFVAAARYKLKGRLCYYSNVEKWVADTLLDGRKTEWLSHCHILKYEDSVPPKYEIPAGVTVDDIDIKWLDLVNDNYTYRDEFSRERIKEEITSRPNSAVYVDGKPVAWALLHDDYAMGAMFVLPEFRRAGYAYIASCALIRKVLGSGMTPYIQVVYDNYASLKLAEKLGFKKIFEAEWFEI